MAFLQNRLEQFQANTSATHPADVPDAHEEATFADNMQPRHTGHRADARERSSTNKSQMSTFVFVF